MGGGELAAVGTACVSQDEESSGDGDHDRSTTL